MGSLKEMGVINFLPLKRGRGIFNTGFKVIFFHGWRYILWKP